MVFVDLDEFKAVNDHHGHAAKADAAVYRAKTGGRGQIELAR